MNTIRQDLQFALLTIYTFFQNVVIDNKDNKIAAREKICNETNIFRDGDSSKRVAEFIIRKIEKN